VKIRERMAAAIERQKADDPKELRRRIAELERELRAKPGKAPPAPKPAAPPKKVEVPVLTAADRKLLLRASVGAENACARAADLAKAVSILSARVERTVALPVPAPLSNGQRASAHFAAKDHAEGVKRVVEGKHIVKVAPSDPRPSFTDNGSVSFAKGERATLIAIAQHLNGVTRQQLTILTGYKRSTRDAYLQRLRAGGWIAGEGEQIAVTHAGIAALGTNYDPLPTGDALRAHWLGKLPEGERKILEILCSIYPAASERDAISEKTGYARSSRDAYLQRLGARKLVENHGRGAVVASSELFS